MMTLDQPVLFDVDTPPVKSPARKVTGAGKPTWSKCQTVKGAKCDDCMAVLAEAHGEGPASRPARWKRVQGGIDLLLCYAHAAIRRAADGIEVPE